MLQTREENFRSRVLRRAVENIEKRDEYFLEFIKSVCEHRNVVEAYLVGSRARGDYKPSSDFDIVVVIDKGDVVEIAEEISKLRKKPVPIDIIVIRREDLKDNIYQPMLEHKKKLC